MKSIIPSLSLRPRTELLACWEKRFELMIPIPGWAQQKKPSEGKKHCSLSSHVRALSSIDWQIISTHKVVHNFLALHLMKKEQQEDGDWVNRFIFLLLQLAPKKTLLAWVYLRTYACADLCERTRVLACLSVWYCHQFPNKRDRFGQYYVWMRFSSHKSKKKPELWRTFWSLRWIWSSAKEIFIRITCHRFMKRKKNRWSLLHFASNVKNHQ